MTQRSFFDAPVVDMSKGPTLEQAKQRGRRGAEAAGAHANHERRGWMRKACQAVTDFAIVYGDEPWLLERARAAAEATGLPDPPDKRAWGAVIQVLKRKHVIAPAGYAPATSSNGSPKCLWTRGPQLIG